MSLRPVSDSLNRLTGQIFSRKYISLGRIVTSWREIVGAETALRTQPVKIRYRKGGAEGRPQAALDIAAASADAAVLQYRAGIILEKINAIFGDAIVTSIRFVHSPANAGFVAPKRERPLTEREKDDLSGMLAAVDDPDIRSRLESLGSRILSASKKEEP